MKMAPAEEKETKNPNVKREKIEMPPEHGDGPPALPVGRKQRKGL